MCLVLVSATFLPLQSRPDLTRPWSRECIQRRGFPQQEGRGSLLEGASMCSVAESRLRMQNVIAEVCARAGAFGFCSLKEWNEPHQHPHLI